MTEGRIPTHSELNQARVSGKDYLTIQTVNDAKKRVRAALAKHDIKLSFRELRELMQILTT